MARDYDSQLLESVGVRRRRMRDALLFGVGRARRTADERLGKVFAGIAITAVLCAGCVGWSFLQHTLDKQKAEQEKQQRQAQRYDRPTHFFRTGEGPLINSGRETTKWPEIHHASVAGEIGPNSVMRLPHNALCPIGPKSRNIAMIGFRKW